MTHPDGGDGEDGAFASILFPEVPPPPTTGGRAPAYASDLNLDQIVQVLATGDDDHGGHSGRTDLAAYYWNRVTDVDTVHYRHEVMRDLYSAAVLEPVRMFLAHMQRMREKGTRSVRSAHPQQCQAWLLGAVEDYVRATSELARRLDAAQPSSRGLRGLVAHLRNLVTSPGFVTLADEAASVRAGLDTVRYLVSIKGVRVTVGVAADETDYSQEVLEVFDRFRQGSPRDHHTGLPPRVDLDPVGRQILDLVVRLFPEPFAALGAFSERFEGYLDEVVAAFDRDVRFYVAYLGLVRSLESAGLPFCFPEVSGSTKEVAAEETFDLALALKLVVDHGRVVTNDFSLEGVERTLVVSGPNQGGKTTLARTFGQLHHLASLGLPVPGSRARLFLFDQMFTFFGREEVLADLRGRLEDDLVRIRAALEAATSKSIVVLNEVFSSTTLADAQELGARLLTTIAERDLLCVYVTFVDDLATLNPSVVSMVSAVDPEDPSVRTYKVVRRPADGLAHALAMAARHRLTYDQLRDRISS